MNRTKPPKVKSRKRRGKNLSRKQKAIQFWDSLFQVDRLDRGVSWIRGLPFHPVRTALLLIGGGFLLFIVFPFSLGTSLSPLLLVGGVILFLLTVPGG